MTAHLNLDNCFRYHSFMTSRLQEGIPSDTGPELVLKLEMIRPAVLVSNEGETVVNLPELFLLNGSTCRLTFRTGANRHLSTVLRSTDTRWHSITHGICSFSKTIDAHDIEYLSSWRQGETVSIYWSLEGYVILNDNEFGNRLPLRILPFNVNNMNDPIVMGPDVFIKVISMPLGLGEKFIAEFAIQMPPIITSSAALPAAISSLRSYLTTLLQFIKSALDTLRNARTVSDMKGVIGAIRTPLDTVLNYKSQSGFPVDLAKELFIDTSIIRDIPGIPKGAQQAANEIIEDIWKQFQGLSNVCSKVLHTTTKQQGGGMKSSFIMEADRLEVEYLLISALSTINYLTRRMETAVVKA
jgi:hypothetical protein